MFIYIYIYNIIYYVYLVECFRMILVEWVPVVSTALPRQGCRDGGCEAGSLPELLDCWVRAAPWSASIASEVFSGSEIESDEMKKSNLDQFI